MKLKSRFFVFQLSLFIARGREGCRSCREKENWGTQKRCGGREKVKNYHSSCKSYHYFFFYSYLSHYFQSCLLQWKFLLWKGVFSCYSCAGSLLVLCKHRSRFGAQEATRAQWKPLNVLESRVPLHTEAPFFANVAKITFCPAASTPLSDLIAKKQCMELF